MTLNGIDVSAAGQGTAFNWAPYRSKISFAFTKVTEGTGYADPSAARNIAQMRAEGITPGGYHFLHAGEPGNQQAEFFLSHAKAVGLRAGDLIAIDAEDGGMDGLPVSHLNACAAEFVTELRGHFPGYWPVVYTEISLAPSFGGAVVSQCPLWLANPSGMVVKAAGPWKLVSFEQTGQRGVDTDVFYGDAAQLARLAIPH